MAMKVFKFRVFKGCDASSYNLMVQAETEKEAREKVAEIEGKKTRTALYYWAPGDLTTELGGEEFTNRVRKHWHGSHGARWETVAARNKKGKEKTPW